LIKTYVSSSYPKTLEEAKPAFDDPRSKEVMESLTSTKSHGETFQTNTPLTENQQEEEEGWGLFSY
jgi:hypothetical protein